MLNELARMRRAVAWMAAFVECLTEQRQVSILKTHWELEGYLL